MKKLVSVLFFVILLFPALVAIFNLSFNDFDKNFSYRDRLVFFNAARDYYVFRSSANEEVVVGKDAWLYLTETFTSPVLPDKDLGLIVDRLQNLALSLESSGSKLVFSVVPDKKTVYPEYLPGRLSILEGENLLALRKVVEAGGFDFEFYDLSEYFIDLKQDLMLYSPQDTHWNRYAAYLAYRLLTSGEEVELADKQTYSRAGDLSRLIGLNSVEETWEPVIDFSQASDFSALLFIDSFGEGLLPFFREEFSVVDNHHVMEVCPFSFEYSGKEDFVLVQIAERDLWVLASSYCEL